MKVEKALHFKLLDYDVNETIIIHDGEFSLRINAEEISVKGKVLLKWIPNPTIMFECELLSLRNINIHPEPEYNIQILAPEGFIGEADLISKTFSTSGPMKLSGSCQVISNEKKATVSKILFSVVNSLDIFGEIITSDEMMGYWGRTTLIYSSWRIILDKRPDYKETYRKLNDSGGYGITHIGVIERIDNTLINSEDVDSILESLEWLLSFVNGHHVGICCMQGFSFDKLEWERYQTQNISSWSNSRTWFPINEKFTGLNTIFPIFHEKLIDPLWERNLPIIISWYLDSQTSVYLETKIVAVQIALEMLAWTYLVEDKKKYSRTSFKKKDASEKLKLLLQECSISDEIPDIDELSDFKSNYANGVNLLVKMRNNIVHPVKEKYIKDKSGMILFQVLELGYKYLELSILYMLGYNGKYHNRMSTEMWIGKKNELVPWNATSSNENTT